MSTRVVSLYDNDSVVKHSKTTWSFAWGLVAPKDINPNCDSKYLSASTHKTNLGFILLSAVTLGIVVPQTVEWECAPEDPDIEEL
ncbi:Bor family protein [Aquimarina sp. D1M17]|uniref:Bor family protein n=1 Tax=Aquimarina acroporae TaxID=2937283 RepID=UPI0020BE5F02|nr:Bor family protein [Aquimarina acroporae]MCK8519993.1 Bor family protein [Aquimarina acroporae]